MTQGNTHRHTTGWGGGFSDNTAYANSWKIMHVLIIVHLYIVIFLCITLPHMQTRQDTIIICTVVKEGKVVMRFDVKGFMAVTACLQSQGPCLVLFHCSWGIQVIVCMFTNLHGGGGGKGKQLLPPELY